MSGHRADVRFNLETITQHPRGGRPPSGLRVAPARLGRDVPGVTTMRCGASARRCLALPLLARRRGLSRRPTRRGGGAAGRHPSSRPSTAKPVPLRLQVETLHAKYGAENRAGVCTCCSASRRRRSAWCASLREIAVPDAVAVRLDTRRRAVRGPLLPRLTDPGIGTDGSRTSIAIDVPRHEGPGDPGRAGIAGGRRAVPWRSPRATLPASLTCRPRR